MECNFCIIDKEISTHFWYSVPKRPWENNVIRGLQFFDWRNIFRHIFGIQYTCCKARISWENKKKTHSKKYKWIAISWLHFGYWIYVLQSKNTKSNRVKKIKHTSHKFKKWMQCSNSEANPQLQNSCSNVIQSLYKKKEPTYKSTLNRTPKNLHTKQVIKDPLFTLCACFVFEWIWMVCGDWCVTECTTGISKPKLNTIHYRDFQQENVQF